MADLRSVRDGARRAAECLLRTTGGQALQLRLPLPAVAGADAEQLGLAAPLFQDVELAPAVFRRVRAQAQEGGVTRYELLISAACVEELAGGTGADVEVLFAEAYGVLAGDDLLEIESACACEVGGDAYAYRLLLRAGAADLV